MKVIAVDNPRFRINDSKRRFLDALNLSIATDNEIARHWEALAPHKNVFELTNPREISDNISIPKPVIATMSNFLMSKTKPSSITPEQLARFNNLPSF